MNGWPVEDGLSRGKFWLSLQLKIIDLSANEPDHIYSCTICTVYFMNCLESSVNPGLVDREGSVQGINRRYYCTSLIRLAEHPVTTVDYHRFMHYTCYRGHSSVLSVDNFLQQDSFNCCLKTGYHAATKITHGQVINL